jgi:hypothetical protein
MFWLSGCTVLHLNSYQDGRPLGAGRAAFNLEGELAPSFAFSSDTNRFSTTDEYVDVVPGPSLGLIGGGMRFGVAEHIDIGFSIYSTIGATGGRFFLKAGLLPPESLFGMAVLADFGGASTWGTFDSGDTRFSSSQSRIAGFQSGGIGLGVPLSYHPFHNFALYVNPKWSLIFNDVRATEGEGAKVHVRGVKKLALTGGAAGLKFSYGPRDSQRSVILEASAMRDAHLGWIPTLGLSLEFNLSPLREGLLRGNSEE